MKEATVAKDTRLQEIFDQVKEHLLTQNDYSVVVIERDGKRIVCGQYRGPDGKKCAAGVLVPDDRYEASWEGLPAWKLDYFLNNYSKRELSLIDKLQYLHDFYHVDDWYMELQAVAHEFDLNP